jgi:hypothetical protein
LPEFREHDAARGPDEEISAQLRLEFLDLGGQRRLGDRERLGSASKAALGGDLDEVAKLSQFHIRNALC